MKKRILSLSCTSLLLFSLLCGCSGVESLAQRFLVQEAPPEDYTAQEDGFRYVKSCLTSQEQYIYDQLLAGIRDHAESIDGIYPDVDMIRKAAQAISRDYPEMFWFSGSGEIETTYLGSTPTESSYRPVYAVTPQQEPELQAQIDQWAQDCFATIPEGASDYDKVLGVYRYIIDHADYQSVNNNSILNIMVGGAGLCGCYAQTTQYLLNRLGVPCTYISGRANGESHAWNLVWLEGNPCWVDTTWGDPVFDGGNANDGASYEYFCITTTDLLRTHTIDPEIPVPDCTSEDYNYYRRSGLYFDSYNKSALTAAIQRAVEAQEKQVFLRFSDDIYVAACDAMLNQGQLHSIFQETAAAQAGIIDWQGELWYSKNEPMNTLTLTIPYR